MNYLFFDSDILIDAIRQVPLALSALELAERQDTPAASVIVRMELVIGSSNKQSLMQTERLLAKLQLLTLTASIADMADKLITAFYLSHGLQIADALIAATAIVHNAPLLSKNQRDFRFIPGLQLLPYPGIQTR